MTRRRSATHAALAGLAALTVLTACQSGRVSEASPTSTQSRHSVLPVGRSDHAMTVESVDRTFHVYRPESLPASAPLVVVLHGGFGSGHQAEQAYGWDSQADSAGLVVAYPDGLNRAWNTGGGCCGAPGRENTDDVGFIIAMIDQLKRNVPLDDRRLYAVGMSNGAIMTYTLACRTATFAAIGAVSGTQLDSCPTPRPTSVIHIHGTADQTVRYDGSPGTGPAHIDGPAIPDLIDRWRHVDTCSTPTEQANGTVTTSVATCAEAREVQLVTITGGGHQWPGAAAARGADATPPSPVNATALIWAFLTRQTT